MATEWDLKQAAIDALHAMLRGRNPKKFSNAKAEIALGVLEEMREAQMDRKPPEWVQQMLAEEALEQERERKRKD